MILAVELRRVGGCEQEGKGKEKRERRICPMARVPATLAKVVSSSTRNSFCFNSSGFVTWG